MLAPPGPVRAGQLDLDAGNDLDNAMSTETPRQRTARRAKTAAKLNKSIERLYKRSFDLPSFTGKARFIDSIKRVWTTAHVLADNLKTDALS